VNDSLCPVCGEELCSVLRPLDGDEYQCDCPNCGRYRIEGLLKDTIADEFRAKRHGERILSHAIRQMTGRARLPLVDIDLAKRILRERELPSPSEQAENVILWYGREIGAPGEYLTSAPGTHAAIFGTAGKENFKFVFTNLEEQGLMLVKWQNPGLLATLTFQGWERYEQIRVTRPFSRTAFMAMPFEDQTLDEVFTDCLKPGVKDAGFDLLRLDEKPVAGSIDDRLRVEIRRARFLIADLTNGNQGAYWEAGFAEGLGKPVIYTCEYEYFREHKTHFDTNHLHTVIWNRSELAKARQALTVTIRATLPDEADMG